MVGGQFVSQTHIDTNKAQIFGRPTQYTYIPVLQWNNCVAVEATS